MRSLGGWGSVVHMEGLAFLTVDGGGWVAVRVREVGGALVAADGGEPIDLVRLLVVVGLDAVPASV